MAKIGTAHVEVKPVIDTAALVEISNLIEAAVRRGVEAGLAAADKKAVHRRRPTR